jgi:major membrane immunogen (membrane-anchored lipoprotein)
MKFKRMSVVLVILLLILAACSPAAETAVPDDTMADDTMTTDTMSESHDGDMMTEDGDMMAEDSDMMSEDGGMMAEDGDMMSEDGDMMAEGGDVMAEDGDMMAEIASWQQIALTNVRSGETFTLADFAGKTVFVEPMATWCTNCRRQLTNVQAARSQLNNEDVVFVALSVETNISDAELAQYTEDTGFDWIFAVATPGLLDELVSIHGRSIINPPSTPHFIIRPDGTTTELVTGIESPDQLITQITDAQG